MTTFEIPEGAVPVLPDSTIMGLFGKRGSGKSAAMAWMGIDAWRHGRQVIYYPPDFNLDVPGAIGIGPDELGLIPDKLNGAMVLMDELQELMSKFRTNSTLSMLVMSFFRQVRKRGANVVFTSNDPGGINGAVADQTDYHARCELHPDPRCATVGYHLPSCMDAVRLRITDTQGKHGLIPMRKDGRKGWVQTIVGISSVYRHYNTASIADLTDVIAAGKTELMHNKDADKLGLAGGWDEFDMKMMQEIIPELVATGGRTLTPKSFAVTLKNELHLPAKGPPMDTRQLGKHLASYGLGSKRTNRGMVYTLPPAEHLADWQAGLWTPDDWE